MRPALSASNADRVLEMLSRTSTCTLPSMLDSDRRWALLVDVLLGQAPVRGGRTRDHPFSAERIGSCEIALGLMDEGWSFRPGRGTAAEAIDWFDVIVALRLVATARASSALFDDGRSGSGSAALHALVRNLFDAGGRTRLQDVLGIRAEGQEHRAAPREAYERETVSAAQRLAACARRVHSGRAGEIGSDFALRERDVDFLQRHHLALLTIKVRSAQTFIGQCERPFLQRGASFWCAQVSARARDGLLEASQPGAALLMDNDAVSWIVCARADLAATTQQLRSAMLDQVDASQLARVWLARHAPRLLDYYDAARARGLPTAECLPSLALELRAPSLFDFARLPGVEAQTSQLRAADRPAPSDDGARCSGRRADRALPEPFAVPGWYIPGRGEAYGFPSIAFSLADLAYAKASRNALAEQLRARHGLSVATVDTQRELVRALGLEPPRMCHVKLDGDGIGRLFSSTAPLRWPALSLRVEHGIRTAFLEAVAAVVRARDSRVLPVDLLYFGGDDIVATLPERDAMTFIEAFDSALQGAGSPTHMRFTWAVLAYELLPVDHRDREATLAREVQAVRSLNRLLELAKRRRDGVLPGSDTSAIFGNPRWHELGRTQGLLAEVLA